MGGKDYNRSPSFIISVYFEKQGQVYIMPESGADHSLYLYKAVQFPDKWEKLNSIRENVVYGDTTPFKWENIVMH